MTNSTDKNKCQCHIDHTQQQQHYQLQQQQQDQLQHQQQQNTAAIHYHHYHQHPQYVSQDKRGPEGENNDSGMTVVTSRMHQPPALPPRPPPRLNRRYDTSAYDSRKLLNLFQTLQVSVKSWAYLNLIVYLQFIFS